MKREDVEAMIDTLLREVEEEDIGISLFSTFYQNQSDLAFFQPKDRIRVLNILKKLSEDSRRHKNILTQIINHLGRQCHES